MWPCVPRPHPAVLRARVRPLRTWPRSGRGHLTAKAPIALHSHQLLPQLSRPASSTPPAPNSLFLLLISAPSYPSSSSGASPQQLFQLTLPAELPGDQPRLPCGRRCPRQDEPPRGHLADVAAAVGVEVVEEDAGARRRLLHGRSPGRSRCRATGGGRTSPGRRWGRRAQRPGRDTRPSARDFVPSGPARAVTPRQK